MIERFIILMLLVSLRHVPAVEQKTAEAQKDFHWCAESRTPPEQCIGHSIF